MPAGVTTCPAGYSGYLRIGDCLRERRPRTTAEIQCTGDQEYDVGLCYDKCDSGYKGIGPVCWGQCPADTEECAALCLYSGSCS